MIFHKLIPVNNKIAAELILIFILNSNHHWNGLKQRLLIKIHF